MKKSLRNLFLAKKADRSSKYRCVDLSTLSNSQLIRTASQLHQALGKEKEKKKELEGCLAKKEEQIEDLKLLVDELKRQLLELVNFKPQSAESPLLINIEKSLELYRKEVSMIQNELMASKNAEIQLHGVNNELEIKSKEQSIELMNKTQEIKHYKTWVTSLQSQIKSVNLNCTDKEYIISKHKHKIHTLKKEVLKKTQEINDINSKYNEILNQFTNQSNAKLKFPYTERRNSNKSETQPLQTNKENNIMYNLLYEILRIRKKTEIVHGKLIDYVKDTKAFTFLSLEKKMDELLFALKDTIEEFEGLMSSSRKIQSPLRLSINMSPSKVRPHSVRYTRSNFGLSLMSIL